jgi:uncharacterized protein (TIGR02597 family)
MNTVAKLALSLGAIGFALAGATAQAQTNVISDPVGFYKIPLNPGANFVSAPLHPIQTYRGSIASISGSTINFSGSPSFVPNAFAPVTNGLAGVFNQYIAIVRSTTKGEVLTNNLFVPPVVTTNSYVGDWWVITANSTTNITVNPGSDVLASHLNVGDQIEIRKLTSIRDLFGFGATCVLNKDSDGLPSQATEDVVRYVVGTGFTKEIVYYDGSLGGGEGYLVDGDGPFTGETVTIEPDEPLMVFRRVGSSATNITVLGQVQTRPLTHYFQPGANSFSAIYPANVPLAASGLKESKGFVPDADGLPSTSEDDVIRRVVGTGFTTEITLYAGDTSPQAPVWLVNGNTDDTFPLVPGAGYMYFVKPGSGGRVWRQPVPFNP